MILLLILFFINCLLVLLKIGKRYKVKALNVEKKQNYSDDDQQGPIINKHYRTFTKMQSIVSILMYISSSICMFTKIEMLLTIINEFHSLFILKAGMCLSTVFGIIYILLNMVNLHLSKEESYRVIVTKFIMIPLALMFAMWVMSSNGNYIKINNVKLSNLEYCINLIEDYKNQKTVSKNVESKKIYVDLDTRYKDKGGRKNIHNITYSVEKDGKTYTYYFIDEDWNLLKNIENLTKVEDEVLIEYYEKTGIIKSIDNIERTNYTELEERVKLLKKNADSKELKNSDNLSYENSAITIDEQSTNKSNNSEKSNENQDEELSKNQNSNKSINSVNNTSNMDVKALEKEVKLLSSTIGKDIQDVQQQLKDDIVKDYNVKYVSSKMAKINTVVYVSYKNKTIYIVKDDKKEELVKFPKLTVGMEKDDIIDILKETGIKYNFISSKETDNINKVETLSDIPEEYGRLYPKELTLVVDIYAYADND